MFLFHDHKLIYIIVPATGSNSFHSAWKERWKNWELVKVRKRHPLYKWHDISIHEHFTAEQAKQLIDPEIWNSYEKIGFVRHPFNWSKSVYQKHGMERVGINNAGTFKQFLKRLDKTPYFWFMDRDNNMLIDTIYRTEDLPAICKKFELEHKHLNISLIKETIVDDEINKILKKKFYREYAHYK